MKRVKAISGQVVVALLFVFMLTAMDWSNAACGSQPQRAGEGRELYELDIYTNQNGTYTYIVGIALAEILNANLSWIRAVSVESMSASSNEHMMYDADDHMRRHTMYFANGDAAWRGTGTFAGRQSRRSKIGFNFGLVANAMLGGVPNVTRLEEFAGRAVAIRAGNADINPYLIALIESKAQNVRFDRIDFNSAVEGTLSGSIGAWFGSFFSRAADLREWGGNPATVEFLSRARNVHFIDLPLDVDRQLRAIPGGPFEDFYCVVVPIPAGAVDPRQTMPWYVALTNTIFMVDQDFPEDTLFEILRTVGENQAKFVDFHPQGAFITPATMAIHTFPPEFHPGSIRYFNSVGVRPTFLGDLTR